MQQSCFCGLRHWQYDHIAHMEGDGMQQLARTLADKGHVNADFINTGWGPKRDEAFLQSNTVFHRTGASSKAAEYYGVKAHPGVLEHVVSAHMEDIVRFGYEEVIQGIVEDAQQH